MNSVNKAYDGGVSEMFHAYRKYWHATHYRFDLDKAVLVSLENWIAQDARQFFTRSHDTAFLVSNYTRFNRRDRSTNERHFF